MERELAVQNRGTFVRGMSESIIDVTLATAEMARRVEGWKELDEETLSLHKYISFEIRWQTNSCWETRNKGKIDLVEAERKMREYEEDWQNLEQCTARLQQIKRTSMVRRTSNLGSMYWWTDELAVLRARMMENRRRMTRLRRSRRPVEERELVET
ncbi:uncharacterized protein LOC108915049 [Anoplophora glabripennis]|uniref:uncharacterized protein LOC108915049 n=1 Tax=Anoplophora glabripennis TaxID=217634 RepID=UPI0008743E80|nr:uncharacterized protein LOC108915049 [Anoplophora glabripennis]